MMEVGDLTILLYASYVSAGNEESAEFLYSRCAVEAEKVLKLAESAEAMRRE